MKRHMLFYLTKKLQLNCSIPKYLILFSCLGYLSLSLKAQTTLPLDQTITINTLTSEDIIIPEGIESLTVEVRGADGGNARLNGPCDVRVRGGQGATMKVTFSVGPAGTIGKLEHGGILRVFAGRAGQNDDSGCAPVPVGRYGAGGGSSAILYKTSATEWEVLAIAGGGGGGARVVAGVLRNGKGGNTDRAGDATGGSAGGSNGGCGNSDGNGYGGAGVGCNAGGETGGSMVRVYELSGSGLNVQLKDNSYATQTGGTTGIQPIGGDGFTGGATGAGGGGGGGGFSGGAGDSGWSGGGGGSYIATFFTPTNITRQVGADGASTNHPTHGFVKITTKPICPVGDVVLSTQQEVNDFASTYPNCTELSGNLSIQGSDISDLSPLDNITSIDGTLSIFGNDNLQVINGFANLTSVGSLSISLNPSLREVSGFSNLNIIAETLRIYQESNLETIDFPSLTSIGGMLYFGQNDKMINMDGFSSLTSIGDMLTIFENDKLVNLNGLSNLTSVGGIVHISGNATLTNFDGICPLIAGGYNQSNLDIEGNGGTFDPAMDCLICPSGDVTLTSQQEVNNFPIRYINCTELPTNLTIKGGDISDLSPLSNITSIQGNLRIEQNNVLTNLNGLDNISYIGNNLDIRQNPDLLNIDGLGSIREIGNNISIVSNHKLQRITGFSSFETSEGSIKIASNQRLTRIDGFSNLEWLRLGVSISNNPSLISVKGFPLVYSFDEFLSINNNPILTEIDAFDQLTNVSSIGVKIRNNTVLVHLTGFSNLTRAAGLWIDNNPQLTNIDAFCPLFNGDFDLDDFIQSGNGVVFNPEDCICPSGDVTLTSQQEVNNFLTRYPNCTNLEGSLTISGANITNLSPLMGLMTIEGDLIISGNNMLLNLDGFANLSSVGSLILIESNSKLESINGFSRITSIEGNLDIYSNGKLQEINGFANLTSLQKLDIFNNPRLSSLDGFSNLTTILEYFGIIRNGNIIETISFPSLSTVGGLFRIFRHPNVETIDFPSLTSVLGNFHVSLNEKIKNVDGFSNLESVGGVLDISETDSLRNLDGMLNLTSVGDIIHISANTRLTDFNGLCPLFAAGFNESNFIQEANGGIFNPVSDCICPSGDVILTSQQEVNNFGAIYPDCSVVQGDLTIKGADITDLSPLENLASIEGDLFIRENTILTTLNGLVNITSIGKTLFIYKNPALLHLDGLTNLTSVERNVSISFNNSLQDLGGLDNLRTVESLISISYNSSLQTINGFANLSRAKDGISIANNSALTKIEGFSKIRIIYEEGFLSIFSNRALVEVDAFHSLETAAGDGIGIENNNSLTTLNGFSNLRTVTELYVQNNPQLTNFETFCPLFEAGFDLNRFFQSGNGAIFDPEVDCLCPNDNISPEIVCIENTSREIATSTLFYTVRGNEFDALATDDCELESLTNNINNTSSLAGEQFELGTHEIIWTAVDIKGNSISCTTNVVIEYPVGDYFITTWQTTSANESITIPTEDNGYNYVVDWGDGMIETGKTGDGTHVYASPGIYTVRITGDFPQIFFNNTGDKDKIQTIEQWGAIEWRSMANAFMGCANLNITNPNIDRPDLSNVTDISGMFSYATTFNGFIGHWDVSNITNMMDVFFAANSFNQDLSNWKVDKVTAMDRMFFQARAFNQNIGQWNVSEVVGMELMFFFATSFNQPIGNWDVSNVKFMRAMFERASSFNQPIGNWDVSKVENMSSMFKTAGTFNQDISQWDVSNVTNFKRMFDRASAFDQNIGGWNVEKVQDIEFMFSGTGLSTSNYDALLIGWSTQNLQTGLTFDAGGSMYCEGTDARAILEQAPNNWIITDAGIDVTCLPTALCQDISIELADNGEIAITPEQIDMGSSSPIGEVDLSLDISTFTCNELGDNTVILTVTDMNGKSSNCTATVTVEVNEPQIPIATVGEDQVICDAMSLPLGGNDPMGGVGLWSGPDGVSFLPDANDPNAIAQGLPTGASSLTWTISGGICQNTSNSASIQITSTEITTIVAGAQTTCDPWTNTYSQTLEISHAGVPATGHLSVNEQLFPIETSPQTVVLTDLSADGQPVDVEAYFTERAECTFTQNNLFTAPNDCSVPCDIISVIAGDPYNCNPNSDTYHRDLTVEYQGTNLTGNFMVSVNGGATISYPILSQSPQVLTLEGLPSNGEYTDIEIYISEESNCNWVTNNFFQNPQNCGDNPTGDCDISDLTVAEQRCNYEDETYDQDLIITYTDAPTGGTILLKVNGQEDWESFPITGSPQVLPLEGRTPGEGDLDIFVKFSDDNGCTFYASNLFSAPEACVLPCSITSIATGAQTACDPTTNTYSQELIIIYENEPTNSSLIIGEQVFGITGSPQMITLTNLPSNGNEVDISAYFTDDSDCQLIENNLFTAPEACTQPPSGDGIVLFVVKDANSMHSGDASVKNQLENTGYTVEVKSENASQTSDATGKALVLISNTVSSGAINTKFTNIDIPVVCYESLLFDELGMTGGNNGSDYGQDSNEQTIDIDEVNHVMSAGLTGEAQVYNSNGNIIWGEPNDNAIKVVSTQGWYEGQWAIFGYETGSAMVNGIAPARRASLFFKADQVSKLTTNGWALFDAVICWATGCQTARFAPEVSLIPLVKAYPNPFLNSLTIEWDKHAQEVQIILRNLLGQEVIVRKVWLEHNYELNTSNISEGMYILEVIGDGFKQEVKVVKE